MNNKTRSLLFIISTTIILAITQTTVVTVDAGKKEKSNIESNVYFSIEIPDNWIYQEYPDNYAADITGYGIYNAISLFPNEFDFEEINNNKGAFAIHDNEPYDIGYQSDQANYDKYLPEFEQMVNTFKFRD